MASASLVDVGGVVLLLEDGGLPDEVELVGRHLLKPQLRLAAHAPRVVARLLLLCPEGNPNLTFRFYLRFTAGM